MWDCEKPILSSGISHSVGTVSVTYRMAAHCLFIRPVQVIVRCLYHLSNVRVRMSHVFPRVRTDVSVRQKYLKAIFAHLWKWMSSAAKNLLLLASTAQECRDGSLCGSQKRKFGSRNGPVQLLPHEELRMEYGCNLDVFPRCRSLLNVVCGLAQVVYFCRQARENHHVFLEEDVKLQQDGIIAEDFVRRLLECCSTKKDGKDYGGIWLSGSW